MTDISLYVAAKIKQFRKLRAEADAVIESKRDELRENDRVVLSRAEFYALQFPNQLTQELAYGLDEAMRALEFYANENTWTEVPAKTLAADDRGMKARVALARIDPV